MPVECAFGAAVMMSLLWGEFECSILTVLCFAGLLRFGEASGLTDARVHVRAGHAAVILDLGNTKRGFEERVVLTNPGVVAWVLAYLRRRRVQPNGRFAAVTYARFTRILRSAMAVFGLASVNWRTHCLRRGGATYLYESGADLLAIRLYGRWASESSARLYIRSGANALLRLKRDLGDDFWRRMQTIASVGAASMET